ncbi:carbohydrate binding protein with CBM11 domain [Actinoplanes italicus]|uniref:mannan endo-1,4-beta-mannosidase n=2 Tax=Actinoplanes italicus TaxID=113567 RepID=A0A2T0K174_9ACTN|nr:carbohydrate binding protein with CBM11 domain [Actinoplanes italicus]
MTAFAASAVVPAPAFAHASNQFVTRDGTQLRIGKKPFRFAGTNLYWLGLDENVGGVDHPTYFRIRDALDTAKAMGMTVVRSHMLASTGHPKALLPSKEAGFNDEAFHTIDYAVAHAGKAGIRLILPLTDNWAYYHGGHADFTKPYGLPGEAFYTDPRVIADYQAYVKHVMHHVNPLTGKRLVDDPTIMAWELGNELEGMTAEWINANAAVFSAWAPRQLIAAGRRFDIDADTLTAPDIDIVDVHYYPPTAVKVRSDAATVAAAGKVYIAGEYASNAASSELLTPLVADPNVTGMLSWSLFGHHDRHGFVQHDDGFTFHYPGDDERMTAANRAQIAYAEALGASTARKPAGTPLITEITKRGGLNVVQWRGAAAADAYRVERSRSERGPWRPAHNGLITDNDTPWTDLTAPGDVWYRVTPLKNGKTGKTSDPMYAGRRETVLVDPLETFDLAGGQAGLELRPGADDTAAHPTGAGPAWISWHRASTRRVTFDLLTSARPHLADHRSTAADRRSGLAVQVSDDGTAWRTVRASVDRSGDGRYSVNATLPGVDHVRLAWTGDRRAGLTRATLWSDDPTPVTGAPPAFAVVSPAAGATEVIGPDSFSWQPADGAGYYTLTLSRSANLSDPVITATGLPESVYEPPQGLDPATTWYWSVRAVNAAGSTTTPVAAFTTRAVPAAPVTIDDFEGYADDAALTAAYVRNTGGDPVTSTLVPALSGDGRAMALDVIAGSSGYAGVSRTFPAPLDLWGQEGIEFQLDRSATQATITVQFVAGGVYWEHTLPATTASGLVRVPFTAFAPPPWAPGGDLNLQKVTQLSLYLGGAGGRLTIDDVKAFPPTR